MNASNALQKNRSNKYSYILQIIFVLACVVAVHHAAVGVVMLLPAAVVLRAVVMQFFAVILPGAALYLLLYRYKRCIFGAMCIAYILGYTSNIASYFLLIPLGLQKFAPCYVAVLAVISVYVIFKCSNRLEIRKLCTSDIVFFAIFLFYLPMCTIAYSGANASPALTGTAWLPADHLFWLENAAALTKEFPPQDFRAYVNYKFYYHFFSSIQIAFMNVVSGVDCFTLGTTLYAVIKCIVFYGAICVFITDLTKNTWLRVFGVFAICFSSGMEEATITTYASHIWTHPFGFDMGFGLSFFFLHCFYKQCDEDHFNWRTFVLALISLAAVTGLKAPIAVVVIVAAGIVCFGWLYKKKYALAFSYGIGLLAVFFMVAVFVVGFGSSSESSTGSFSLWNNLRDSDALLGYVNSCFNPYFPSLIRGFTLFVIYHLGANLLVFGLFFIACLSILFDKRMWTAQNIGLLLSGIFGIALGSFNIQTGSSQMYFTMAAVIPCVILNLRWLEHKLQDWNKPDKRFAFAVLAGLLIVQNCFLFYQSFTYWGDGLSAALVTGYRNMFIPEGRKQEFRPDAIQDEDLVALEWIRDNTPEDSVVLSDRSVVCDIPNYMYYGAFSERQAYLEGDIYFWDLVAEERDRLRGIVKDVYANDRDALRKAISDGVDYVVQTKWLTEKFSPDEDLLRLVFSSDSINVYEVVR